jgi:hypothetical protein
VELEKAAEKSVDPQSKSETIKDLTEFIAHFQKQLDRANAMPPADLIDDAYNFVMGNEIREIACRIADAREIWREHQKLVESRQFPKFLQPWLDHREGDWPAITPAAIKLITPEKEKEVRVRAIDGARSWMTNGVAEKREEKKRAAAAASEKTGA